MKLTLSDFEIKIPDIKIDNTSEIKIGSYQDYTIQTDACEILQFALESSNDSNNVFLVGPNRSGRRGMTRKIIERISLTQKAPQDLMYVFNFKEEKKPKLLKLPAGEAKNFKSELQSIINSSVQVLNKTMQTEEFQQRLSSLEKEYNEQREKLWSDLRKQAQALGFILEASEKGIVSVPVYDGKKISTSEFENLPEEIKEYFRKNSEKLRELIEKTMVKITEMDKEYWEEVKNLRRYWAAFSLAKLFEPLEKKYLKYSDVFEYLQNLKEDIASHLSQLTSENQNLITYLKEKRYNVNIIVDNSYLQGAPVIEEDNPTFSNLVGRIEYYSQMGLLQTDFTMIKSGAFHRANGGYLIMEAEKVLRKPYAWEVIKRFLSEKEVKIENIQTAEGYSSVESLEPEPLSLTVKVILIGEEWVYNLLRVYDSEFEKLFPIKSQFDYEAELSNENLNKFLAFLSNTVEENDISHFTKDAIEEIIKYSCRMNGNNKRFSLRLGEIKNLLIDSFNISRKNGSSPYITAKDIKDTIKFREKMFSFHKKKLFNAIKEQKIDIRTEGSEVGQINGLTVLDTGDFTFGHPVKITAKSYRSSSEKIINIHRDIDLSGKIYKKSSLIIENYFKHKFSSFIETGFGVSLNFEQVYSIIEGDSATIAETLALMSSIANIPLKQNIAITGSMNQNGEVLPVGGIIEKIEGFYDACKNLNFTGDQGVIIPSKNIDNIVLKDEINEDIQNGKFHIWAIDNIDEGIELMTDYKAGTPNENGEYEEGTFYYYVSENLKKLSKEEKKEKDEKDNK
ncbi:ATP-dependent protease [Petrotoga sp. 9T1HF07.CasAA.8.2]|uniref:Lon protease family protein n=1 Tax=Petrotoga sp. 9T1HF07.CasAA.8.2 TaxID=1434329 RepID=UPI000CB2DD6E|nr:ATP-binding protein [Petrotoga sp. 9T1HF07.CasAA.8.2]PNR89419.1 ATP-dependent protease [Petrotoga sp. 9T1HF07.CasAA.8.2]